MLDALLPLLPERLTAAPTGVLAGACAGGLLLGWFGARFSRAQCTLLAAVAGMVAGLRLPPAFQWTIDPLCLGVAGAVVVGTAGFLFHRTLLAAALGAVLALCGVAGIWITFAGRVRWDPSQVSQVRWSGDTLLYFRQLWLSLPGDLGRLIPAVGAGAVTIGLLTGVFWPRLCRCLLYTTAGLAVALTTGLIVTVRLAPDWLARVPQSPVGQLALVIAWAGASLLVQWRLTTNSAGRRAPASPPRSERRMVANQVGPVPSRETAGAGRNRAARGGGFLTTPLISRKHALGRA